MQYARCGPNSVATRPVDADKAEWRPLRLLLDTNVVVAGLLWNGAPRRLIEHAIAGALAAEADVIVTGDRRHLLPLGRHRGIGIVTGSDVITRIGSIPARTHLLPDSRKIHASIPRRPQH